MSDNVVSTWIQFNASPSWHPRLHAFFLTDQIHLTHEHHAELRDSFIDQEKKHESAKIKMHSRLKKKMILLR